MKKTAAAWAFWLTGTALLFVVEWFRVAAAGRPLRRIPDGMMLALAFCDPHICRIRLQGTSSIRRPSLRFACTALQIVAILAIHFVAGQFAIHLYIQHGV